MLKRNHHKRSFILIILWISGSTFVYAQSYSQLIFDEKQTAQVGSANLITLHHVLYGFEDAHIRDTLFSENSGLKKTAGIGYRFAKLFLLDQPIDQFISLTQHEVFGHGFRFREFEFESIFYNLNLTYPYGKGGGYAGAWGSKITPTLQERNVLNTGGVEANRLMADNITYQVLLDDNLHYRQGLLFNRAQNNLFRYLWSSRTGEQIIDGSNDMNNYINGVNYMYGNGTKNKYNFTILSNQSFISFINPMQLYALYTVLYTYGVKGEKSIKKIPMIRLFGVRYLPAFNYSLTPFGSQYHVVNHVRYKQTLISGEFMLGDKTFNEFYGISLKGFNLLNKKRLSLNVHADIWNQPELELENYSAAKRANTTGGSLKADIHYRPYDRPDRLGLFAQVGYKSNGFVMGEMLSETYILRFGLSMHL